MNGTYSNDLRFNVLVGICLLVSASHGAEAPGQRLAGRTVVTTRSGVEIKRDEKVILRCEVGCPLDVTEQNGSRLRCKYGWFDERDVVTSDQSIHFFTVRISADPSAEHFYERARAYFWQEKIDLALLDLSRCLARQPRFAKGLALRGQCWIAKAQWQDAMNDLNAAIEIEPQEPRFYVARATVYSTMDSDKLALSELDAALRCNPDFIQARLARAMCFHNLRKWPEAIDNFTTYIERVPDDASAYRGRALSYAAFTKSDEAAKDLSSCVRLEPDCASHYAERGTVFAVAKEYEKAISDFRTALELSPQNAKFHYYLGSVLVKNSKIDAGLRELDKALSLDPNLADAYLIRAMCWGEQKDYRKALADAKLAAEKAPTMAQTHLLLAMILGSTPDAAVRNGPEAVRAAEKACQLTDYKDAVCLQSLAAAHAEAGDFDEAVRWQTTAIELNQEEDAKQGLAEALSLFKQKMPLRFE